MSQKKLKKLRKSLGMTSLNHTQKELLMVNKTKKIVYFRQPNGELRAVEAVRGTIINKNLNLYRKKKKELKRNKQSL
jgi:hypothetical protein